jgi:hypothetical protein
MGCHSRAGGNPENQSFSVISKAYDKYKLLDPGSVVQGTTLSLLRDDIETVNGHELGVVKPLKRERRIKAFDRRRLSGYQRV